jgi:predicted O-methyltransferase YrrM
MNDFHISRLSFTDLFWRAVFSNGTVILDQAKASILSKHLHIEGLRKSAEYNTGSISLAASVSLALLSNYFRPKLIAEVGTFIGRSTYSLALGPSLSGLEAQIIHTCDISNEIHINFDTILERVTQYRNRALPRCFKLF